MTLHAREVSLGELRDRRTAILASLGVTYGELAARAEARSLAGEEWNAWDELQGIRFLEGGG